MASMAGLEIMKSGGSLVRFITPSSLEKQKKNEELYVMFQKENLYVKLTRLGETQKKR